MKKKSRRTSRISRQEFIKRSTLGFLSLPILIPGTKRIFNISKTSRTKFFNCILTPEEVSGPFNLGPEYLRKDITEGIEGFPIKLKFEVLNAFNCEKIRNATISVWQSDAGGVYSGVGESFGNTGGKKDTSYLRGYQVTDQKGEAEFKTIFPGWYQGRVAHIHYEIILPEADSSFISQIYFPVELESKIHTENDYYRERGANPFNRSNDFVINGNTEKSNKLIPEIKLNKKDMEARVKVGLDV